MKDNTPNTEIYFPKPTDFPVRDKSCSGDRLRSISYSKQRPGQSSERHQAPHGVVCVPYIQAHCFEMLVVPVSTEHRALGKGPA